MQIAKVYKTNNKLIFFFMKIWILQTGEYLPIDGNKL